MERFPATRRFWMLYEGVANPNSSSSCYTASSAFARAIMRRAWCICIRYGNHHLGLCRPIRARSWRCCTLLLRHSYLRGYIPITKQRISALLGNGGGPRQIESLARERGSQQPISPAFAGWQWGLLHRQRECSICRCQTYVST